MFHQANDLRRLHNSGRVLVSGECLSMDSSMVHYGHLPSLIAKLIARIRTSPYKAILPISNLFFSVTIQLLLRLQGHFTAMQPWRLSIAAEWDLSRSTCFVSTGGNILHDDAMISVGSRLSVIDCCC